MQIASRPIGWMLLAAALLLGFATLLAPELRMRPLDEMWPMLLALSPAALMLGREWVRQRRGRRVRGLEHVARDQQRVGPRVDERVEQPGENALVFESALSTRSPASLGAPSTAMLSVPDKGISGDLASLPIALHKFRVVWAKMRHGPPLDLDGALI